MNPYDILLSSVERAIVEFQTNTNLRVIALYIKDTGFNNGKPCPPIVRVSSESQPKVKTVVSKNEIGQTLVNGVIRRSDCENMHIPSQSEYCKVPSCKGCYTQPTVTYCFGRICQGNICTGHIRDPLYLFKEKPLSI